jgi:hypothetical protein
MPEDQKFHLHFSGHGTGTEASSVRDAHSVSNRETGRSPGPRPGQVHWRRSLFDPEALERAIGEPEEAARVLEGMNAPKKTLKIENFDASFPVLQRGDPDIIVLVVFTAENGARQTARLDVQKAMFLDAIPEPLNREWTARVITNHIWL